MYFVAILLDGVETVCAVFGSFSMVLYLRLSYSDDFLAGRCTSGVFLYTYVSGRHKKSLDTIPVLKVHIHVGFQMCYRHGITCIYVVSTSK